MRIYGGSLFFSLARLMKRGCSTLSAPTAYKKTFGETKTPEIGRTTGPHLKPFFNPWAVCWGTPPLWGTIWCDTLRLGDQVGIGGSSAQRSNFTRPAGCVFRGFIWNGAETRALKKRGIFGGKDWENHWRNPVFFPLKGHACCTHSLSARRQVHHRLIPEPLWDSERRPCSPLVPKTPGEPEHRFLVSFRCSFLMFLRLLKRGSLLLLVFANDVVVNLVRWARIWLVAGLVFGFECGLCHWARLSALLGGG